MFTKGCCEEEVSFPMLYWLAIDISPDMGIGLKQVLSDAYLVADTRRLRENIISLPDETIHTILEYTLPQKECQRLEWIGILSRTCKSFRNISQGFAPKTFVLLDYVSYDRIVRPRSFDARVGILKSIHKFSWMRANLEEFHVSRASILRSAGYFELLHRVLFFCSTEPEVTYPKLRWLDIDIDSSVEMDLIHSISLFIIPIVMPSLQKVCFSGIFKSTDPEACSDDDSDNEDSYACSQISPYRLKDFCTAFKTPLNSLSLNGPDWMTDDHVEEIMPIIGKNLTRLEFIQCRKYDYNEVEEYILQRQRTNLSDSSLFSIARHCNNLEYLSIVDSDITSAGLEKVLSANPKITTLNLGNNHQLDAGTMNIISRYAPKLKTLRNGGDMYETRLNDTTLKALVDAKINSSGDSSISLERIGVYCKGVLSRRRLTIGGIKYAIAKGLKEIEMDESALS